MVPVAKLPDIDALAAAAFFFRCARTFSCTLHRVVPRAIITHTFIQGILYDIVFAFRERDLIKSTSWPGACYRGLSREGCRQMTNHAQIWSMLRSER